MLSNEGVEKAYPQKLRARKLLNSQGAFFEDSLETDFFYSLNVKLRGRRGA